MRDTIDALAQAQGPLTADDFAEFGAAVVRSLVRLSPAEQRRVLGAGADLMAIVADAIVAERAFTAAADKGTYGQ